MSVPSRFTIHVSKSAQRALIDELPEAVAVAAWEFIKGLLAEQPTVVGMPLRTPLEGQWVARRGQYRIRYTIDSELRIVTILVIKHRRDAYRH